MLCVSVHAKSVVFGVTPPRIYANNLLPDSLYQAEVILTKSSTEALNVTVSVDGPLKDCILTNKEESFIMEQDRVPLLISMKIPADIQLGATTSVIYVQAVPVEATSMTTELVFPIKIYANVSNIQRVEYSVKKVSVEHNEDVMRFSFDIDNYGNMKVRPRMIEVNIIDTDNGSVESFTIPILDEIAPFNRDTLTYEHECNLEPGNYWVDLRATNEGIILDDEVSLEVPGEESQKKLQANIGVMILLFIALILIYLHKHRVHLK